jgi:guanylate kinase
MMIRVTRKKRVFPVSDNPLVIVVSGPSGVGKDAILNRMKEAGHPFEYIITVTTRPRRDTEKNGVDYHFVSPEEFSKLQENNGLLEQANVYGNWYGVPREPVKQSLASGKDTIIKVDVQGAATIKKKIPQAVFIFIAPHSPEELYTRLKQRSSESASDLERRLKTAENELEQIPQFDYLIINKSNEIDRAIESIEAVVMAEKCRANPRKIVLDD